MAWDAIDPARSARAVVGLVAGMGILAIASIGLLFHVALFLIGAAAAIAVIVLGYRLQHVRTRVEGDEAWLVVRDAEERRIYLPDVTSFDWEETGGAVHAVAALRAGPRVVIGVFPDVGQARGVLAPLRAHWHRVREPQVVDAAQPAPPVPAVRAPRGLRARRRGGRLVLRGPRFTRSRLSWLLALAFAAFATVEATAGATPWAGVYVLWAVSSLRAKGSAAVTAEVDDGIATVRGPATTVRAALSRLVSLEVDSDGTICAALRGGGHVALPALASPADAAYLAQELGAALGIPVVAPALPSAPAIPALPAGEPRGAT